MTDNTELLQKIAVQLYQWAYESKEGGWSTHQVEPMKKLASEIYMHLATNKSQQIENPELIK